MVVHVANAKDVYRYRYNGMTMFMSPTGHGISKNVKVFLKLFRKDFFPEHDSVSLNFPETFLNRVVYLQEIFLKQLLRT